ncbi:MAG TPA: SRPBCC family protein [Rhabdaerophilum sp.]|nr:SRPBCC family protein [Rhabdaerophilum sp.]
MPGTVHLHRVFPAKPEKLFRAFIDPDATAQWIPPEGFVCKVHHMEPRVGGTFRMTFVNFSTGNGHSFGGEYLEIEPNRLLRYTDKFDDPNLPGTIEVTVRLTAVSCGTEVHIEQSGIPDVIPVEQCYLGWQQSLNNLARLVTPEIPG